jgi:hypothetical protein
MTTVEFRTDESEKAKNSGHAASDALIPKRDLLGNAFLIFHLAVSAYIVGGWLIPNASALVFYLAFLPVVAMQWQVNRGSCVIDNLESLLRTGRWRNPRGAGEGRFVSMLLLRAFGLRIRPGHMDAIGYGGLALFWVLAFRHLSVLGDPALLSLFP